MGRKNKGGSGAGGGGKAYRVAAGAAAPADRGGSNGASSSSSSPTSSSKRARRKDSAKKKRGKPRGNNNRKKGKTVVVVKMSKAGVSKQARDIAHALRARGVRLLAIDWDLTMLDVHTHDRWAGSPKQLASHVRPRLKALARAAARAGVRVAIVSFTQQVELLVKTLHIVFPKLPKARVRPYRQDQAPPSPKDRKRERKTTKSPLPSARRASGSSDAGSSTSASTVAGSTIMHSESKGGGGGGGGPEDPQQPKVAPQRIVVRGLDDSWNVPPYSVIPPAWHRAGTKRKVAHLISVVIELASQEHGPEAGRPAITPAQCLLIDDDAVNVEHARSVGVPAAWLPVHNRDASEGAVMDELLRVFADGGAWKPLPKPPLCGCWCGTGGGGGCAVM